MNRIHTRMPAGRLTLLAALVLALGLMVGGCNASSSYDDHTKPRLTKTDTPIIEAETLKDWIDQGLVNKEDDGTENVVILVAGRGVSEVPVTDEITYQLEPGENDCANYDLSTVLAELEIEEFEVSSVSCAEDADAGEFTVTVVTDTITQYDPVIPGAYYWPTLGMSRLEALAEVGTSVIDGPAMDEVLQRSGVNRNSTIVIASSHPIHGSRAYFSLRYWGFSRDKIKFLNGGCPAWLDAGFEPASSEPRSRDSNFSVRDNFFLNDDLRYSLGEMIQIVDTNRNRVAATGEPAVNIIHNTTGDPAISTGIGRHHNWMRDENNKFLSAEEIEAVLLDEGVGDFVEGRPSVVHCMTGMHASVLFMAMDGILGWDVALYDGSFFQWNAYMDREDGEVANDAWRTDLEDRSNGPSIYTGGTEIDPNLNRWFQRVDHPGANQIENEDQEYMAGSGVGDGGGDAPAAGGY